MVKGLKTVLGCASKSEVDQSESPKSPDPELTLKGKKRTTSSFIFTLTNIIGSFRTHANRPDLYKLRQLSQLYYRLLNPTFLDVVGKALVFTVWNSSSTLLTRETISIGDINGEDYQTFPVSTITQEISHIFRKLKLRFTKSHDGQTGFDLNSVICQLNPYITILVLDTYWISNSYSKVAISRLITTNRTILQFQRLKELSIEYDEWGERMPFSLTDLQIFFLNLQQRPHITLIVNRNYEPVLKRFGNKTGVSIVIMHRSIGKIPGYYRARDFQALLDKYGELNNLKLNFKFLWITPLTSELIAITSLCSKYKNKIQTLHLFLDGFPERNSTEEATIKQCLVKLSPVVTMLEIRGIRTECEFCLNELLPQIPEIRFYKKPI